MRVLGKAFIRGAAIVIPLGLTVYILAWLVTLVEQPLKRVLPYYVPGMGLVFVLLVMLLVGLLTYWRVFRAVVKALSTLLDHVPLIRTLYGGLCDLTDFVTRTHDHEEISHVVMCTLDGGMRILGFVTRETFDRNAEEMTAGEDRIAVYIPMSYQIGGFTVFVRRDRVEPVDMSVETAMRFALTAGMSTVADEGVSLPARQRRGHERRIDTDAARRCGRRSPRRDRPPMTPR